MSGTFTPWSFLPIVSQLPYWHAYRAFGLTAPRLGSSRRFTARVLALSACLLSCGPSFEVPGESAATGADFGQAAFALTAETAGRAYALRDAHFIITGAETFTLESGEAPDATTLSIELPSGAYSVELAAGYRLVELASSGEVEVGASLETPNPQSTLIHPEQTTSLTYLFRTAGTPVSFGPGSLALAIAVEQAEHPGLVISEFMVNPSAVSDTSGEWLELANTSDAPVSLDGCRMLRDGAGFTIDDGLTVPANGFFTLANGTGPGFAPGYVYSGMTLPNSAPFVLSLECNGMLVDSLEIDPSRWPLASGISASLGAGSTSPIKNDAPEAWCLATKIYETDFGTPGAANDACAR